jgi:hypothetical protein
MEVVFVFIFAAVFFFAGYGFRGVVGRELKALSAELKTEFAKVEAAIKSKI